MKTVAIVGAGPSGLVTAKILLRSKAFQYKVTIFEKLSEVGGLWAVHRERPYDGLLNPDMPTNLSRFNIGFSDLHWSSVGLSGHVPYWPKAWQVGQYLRAYTDKYIPKEVFRFNTKVVSAMMVQDGTKNLQWKLKWQTKTPSLDIYSGSDETEEAVFDHLVVASGFFGASAIPPVAEMAASNVKVAHSTKLRGLQDVVPDNFEGDGTILVVGGGMSGADVATVLASQLSDALCSPSKEGKKYSQVKLVQLCPDAAYALPLTAAYDTDQPTAPHFMPLELAMYDLSKRPPGDIEMGVGKVPVEFVQILHGAFQALVGNQSDLGVPGLIYRDTSRATYVTLTEQYSGFIRSGDIGIAIGRLKHVEQVTKDNTGPRVNVTYRDGTGKQKQVENVIGIVYATGFTPQPSLEYLGPEILEALEHDRKHNRLPILLDKHATLRYTIPGLAVVGFYEGAFWGSMEMQARLIDQHWSQSSEADGQNQGRQLNTDIANSTRHLHDLRQAMNEKDGLVPQYWMGDYVGMMEQLARETGVERNEVHHQEDRAGAICVARYCDDTGDRAEANKMLAEYTAILQGCNETLFVGRSAFMAMQGNWCIYRKINSKLGSMPSGDLEGTASFRPRVPTSAAFDFEYLYDERGTFKTSTGLSMNATRRYVYRYHEATDKVTVWFVKDDGRTVDYMYHGLEFDPKDRSDGWVAKADHLCVADMYRSDYRFKFKGSNLSTFIVTHAVEGPKKDYVSETVYTR